MLTAQDIIKMYEERHPMSHDEEMELDAYVAARMLRVLDHMDQHKLGVSDVREYMSDTVQYWMGG